MKKLSMLVNLIMIGLLTACSSKNSAYNKISQEEANKIINSDEEIIILDVRTKEEYDEGHIKNSVLIPDFEIASRAEKELPDKNAKILVYCRSGRRSEAAAKELVSMGYTNVLDFGGLMSWPYDL